MFFGDCVGHNSNVWLRPTIAQDQLGYDCMRGRNMQKPYIVLKLWLTKDRQYRCQDLLDLKNSIWGKSQDVVLWRAKPPASDGAVLLAAACGAVAADLAGDPIGLVDTKDATCTRFLAPDAFGSFSLEIMTVYGTAWHVFGNVLRLSCKWYCNNTDKPSIGFVTFSHTAESEMLLASTLGSIEWTRTTPIHSSISFSWMFLVITQIKKKKWDCVTRGRMPYKATQNPVGFDGYVGHGVTMEWIRDWSFKESTECGMEQCVLLGLLALLVSSASAIAPIVGHPGAWRWLGWETYIYSSQLATGVEQNRTKTGSERVYELDSAWGKIGLETTKFYK